MRGYDGGVRRQDCATGLRGACRRARVAFAAVALAGTFMLVADASPAFATSEEGFSGTVSAAKGVAEGVEVWACESSPPNCSQPAFDDRTTVSKGAYTLPIGEGEYYVRFEPGPKINLLPGYYVSPESHGEPAPVKVNKGSVTPNISAVLVEGGQIEGTITDAFTGALMGESSSAEVFDATGKNAYGLTYANAEGHYVVNKLPVGEYLLRFWDQGGAFPYNFYPTKVKILQPGEIIGGTNEAMWPFAYVSGGVYDATTHQPIQNATVKLYAVKTGQLTAYASVKPSGEYVAKVPAGEEYKLSVEATKYATQFYSGKAAIACAQPISVVQTLSAKSINVSMTTSAASLAPCTSGGGGGGGPTGHVAISSGRTLKALGGKTLVALGCSGGATCHVKVVLTSNTAGHAATVARLRRVVVGTATVSIAAGRASKVRISLSRSGKRLLAAHHGRIGVRMTVTGSAGSTSIRVTKNVTLVRSRR